MVYRKKKYVPKKRYAKHTKKYASKFGLKSEMRQGYNTYDRNLLNAGTGLPATLYYKDVYSHMAPKTAGGGVGSVYHAFAINDLYNPDRTVGITDKSALYLAQMKLIYGSYAVTGALVDIDIMNNNTLQLAWALAYDTTGTTSTSGASFPWGTYDSMVASPTCVGKGFIQADTSAPAVIKIKRYLNMSKITGEAVTLTGSKWINDSTGSYNQSPTLGLPLWFYAEDATGGTGAISLSFDIKITFYVKAYNLLIHALS